MKSNEVRLVLFVWRPLDVCARGATKNRGNGEFSYCLMMLEESLIARERAREGVAMLLSEWKQKYV